MKTKKKSGKRFLSWLLAAVMIITLMPATAFAEPPTESSGNTETAVTSYCPSSEGGTDVSVGEYDSSPAAETKDTPTEEPAKDTPTAEPVKESPVADKTTEGAPAQEGAVENSTDEKITEDLTNEVSASELAGLTAMLGAPVSLELYANKSYPIYVYGYFVNGKDKKGEDNILSGEGVVFSKDIKIQKDGKSAKSVRWNDYSFLGMPESDYITFGKIENGTTVKPAKNAEEESISADALEAMLTASLGDSTDMQNQYFSWKDVAIDDWDLHISHGATDYPDEDGKYTWHMDGKIHTYKIKYMADGSDVSKNASVDKDTYYCGTYTIADYEPQAPKGKVFAGWKVKDDTSGKYYQGGDTITLNEFGDKATITLEAQWKDQTYPVYIYGLFKYKDTTFDKTSSLYINGSTASINLNNDSFITFGVLNDATTVDPAPYKDQGVIPKTTIPTAEIETRIKNGDVELSSSTGSAKTNGLLTKSTEISPLVSEWYGLKSCPGATDYVEGDDAAWHLDGKINLYKVTYEKGNIPAGESFTLPTETTYFLGDYTVQRMETSSQNYKFLGWEYNGKVYKDKETIEAPSGDITLTAKWEKKDKVYTVNYKWNGNIPADVKDNLPTDSTEYKEKNTALNSCNEHSFAPINANNGTYTFSGWKATVGTTDYSGDKIVTPITFTGTWTFEAKPVTNYKVAYKWADDSPKDVDLPAKDDTIYDSPEAVLAAVNKVDTTNFKSTEPRQGVAGTWTFDKWEKSSSSDSVTGHVTTTTITYTGTWTFTPTPVTNYKVAYAWDMNAPTNVNLPVDNTIYDSPAAVLAAVNNVDTTNFTSTEPRQGIAGTWTFNDWTEYPIRQTSTNGHVTTITITYIGSWNFTPSETKTITGVLSGLIQKEFKSQYGYSTEGTFTATAKVIAKPAATAISSTTEENVPTDNNAKTFTGTVTLSTGNTKAFTFSAKEAADNVLKPKMRYAVRVSEDKDDLYKVTYDTTKYFLTFDTNENNEVSNIRIAKDEDNEKVRSEQKPEKDNKITFQNIYTYKKRSHSSGDDGNGGGKKEEKPTVEIKDDDALGLNNTDHFAYIVGYGNGEVRPQNSITRAEVAAIFFRLLEDDVRDANYTRQNKFTDVSNDAWYCSAVSTLSAMGIISGYPDATFRPNASITRAEFAAIATRFDVNGDKTPASFNDIADHWAKDEIAVAANNGWVNGYEDGSFRPQNKITRAETMSLVNRVLNRKPETAEDLLENMTKWTDNADTNAWYYLAVQEATNSHYYEYKENSQYEKWTELRETRDWSELDK